MSPAASGLLGLLLLTPAHLAHAAAANASTARAAAFATGPPRDQALFGRPDEESLKEAFLDMLENDEETQALSAELSQRFGQRAHYVFKGGTFGRTTLV